MPCLICLAPVDAVDVVPGGRLHGVGLGLRWAFAVGMVLTLSLTEVFLLQYPLRTCAVKWSRSWS